MAWFIVMDLVALAILVAFPALSLLLPSIVEQKYFPHSNAVAVYVPRFVDLHA